MNENYIECDTEKIKDAGIKICDYLDELQAKVDSFFKTIESIPVTGEWTGKNAEMYSEKVYKDLSIYTKFVSNMKDIADEMKRFSDDTDVKINSCENEVQRNGHYNSSYYY